VGDTVFIRNRGNDFFLGGGQGEHLACVCTRWTTPFMPLSSYNIRCQPRARLEFGVSYRIYLLCEQGIEISGFSSIIV